MTFGSRKWRDELGLTRDWVREEGEARPILGRAVELGVNFFDTADVDSRLGLRRGHPPVPGVSGLANSDFLSARQHRPHGFNQKAVNPQRLFS